MLSREKETKYVRELFTGELRSFSAICNYFEKHQIAGSARTTEKGKRIVIEVDGTPYDGVSSYVILGFSEDENLKFVKAPSGLVVSTDRIGYISDLGGSGLFFISFEKGKETVSSVIALSKSALKNICLLSDAGELISFLLNGDVMPSVRINGEELIMTLVRADGERIRLCYDKMGADFALSSLEHDGIVEKAYWVDIASSKREEKGWTLAISVASESKGKELKKFVIKTTE